MALIARFFHSEIYKAHPEVGAVAHSVLVRIKDWDRYGLKVWIDAAKKRLHHNVLAIALANKLARIA